MTRHAVFRKPRLNTQLDRALRYIIKHGGATLDELEDELHCARVNIPEHLARAITAGVIERGYYLTEYGQRVLRETYKDEIR